MIGYCLRRAGAAPVPNALRLFGVVIAPTRSLGEPPRGELVNDPADDISDLVLARRASLGDRAAFAVIFDRHGAAMFRYAVSMLDGDLDAAEDVVQDALERAWSKLPSFRGEAQLRTWLFRITANVVLSARRRRRPIAVDDQLLTALPTAVEAGPVGELEHSELRAALELALTELPWRQRAAWLLREMEGLSYEEIAEVLQTSPTVVRGQLHRARGTLAVRMVQWR